MSTPSPFNLGRLRRELEKRKRAKGVSDQSPILVQGTLANGQRLSALVVQTASSNTGDGDPEAVYLDIVEIVDAERRPELDS